MPDEIFESRINKDSSIADAAHELRACQLTEIFLNSRTLLKRIAGSILRNDADVEDALQEAYFNALRHLDQFEERSSMLAWVCTILRNHSLRTLQNRRNRSAGSIDSEPGLRYAVELHGAAEIESPERTCIRHQRERMVLDRLDTLPPEVRATIALHYLSEMPLAEIAEVQGKSIPALKSYLYRGRKALRSDRVKRSPFGSYRTRASRSAGAA